MKRLNLNTDTTLNSNSNTLASSQKAIKAYADTKLSKTDAENTYLPKTGGTLSGQLRIEKNTLFLTSSDNSKYVNISIGKDGFVYFSTKVYLPSDSVINGSKILGAADKAVANGVASLDANTKVPAEQIPVATDTSLGGVKLEFDETTGTLNIITE